jgi:hypothetical protein
VVFSLRYGIILEYYSDQLRLQRVNHHPVKLMKEWRARFTHSYTWHQKHVSGQLEAPADLSPSKNAPHVFIERLSTHQSPSGGKENPCTSQESKPGPQDRRYSLYSLCRLDS